MRDMEKAIELYKNGTPLIQTCEMTGVAKTTLHRQLKALGLMRSNKENSRRYDVDHDFFDRIDTEEKAYWLGFMYADGYITQSKSGQKAIAIALSRKDKYHLERFRDALKATYEVKDYTGNSYGKKIQYSRLWITSDKLYDDLKAKGVVEHKSLVLMFPSDQIVPKELRHHFIRGYFDGDGSFSYTGIRDDTYVVKIQGTYEFLDDLRIYIGMPQKEFEKRWDDDKNSYCYEFAAEADVKAFGDYIYKDATVYLERKYERYKAM